ncbi:hypothetical protein [Hahella sp. CCB-MM4]|uniref:hypothetical protein n=1 Tax=Hahella sp. (strain CCB-MM4) TaxID=1926491 RepID=UPI000B9A907E|nr:hypothetical protein [Hahella sp. CCB-MM4]
MKQVKFFLQVALFISLSVFGVGFANAGLITLTPNQQQIFVGDTIGIDVILKDPFEGAFSGDVLSGFGFDLLFDSNNLEFSGRDISSLWDDDSDFFADTDVAASNFPGIDDLGQSEVFFGTLYFHVLSAGDLSLGIVSDSLSSPNQGLFYLSDIADFGTSLTLHVNEVPAPASLAFMVVALGICGARARR